MSAALIRHTGRLCKGVTIEFTFDPSTRQVRCEHSGPLRTGRVVLRRYRAIRFEFLQKIAALIGNVAVVETDEHGAPSTVHMVAEPPAGHA